MLSSTTVSVWELSEVVVVESMSAKLNEEMASQPVHVV